MERRNMKGWAYLLKIRANRRVLWLSLVLAVVIFTPLALSFHKPSNVAQRDGVTFLASRGMDTAESACAYYKAIDAFTNGNGECDLSTEDTSQPNGITFNEWKRRNGFAINPDVNRNGNPFDDDNITGEISALYTNLVDLNLGRSMHAKKVGGDVAFYVCNHLTVTDARFNRNVQACVAMDFSVISGANNNERFTRFYVFNPQGKLSLAVDLDKNGKKFVPGLCVACHGGNRSPFPTGDNPNSNIGTHFLPFDLDNFIYLNTQTLFSRTNQEGKFRRLNELIRDIEGSNAITELIDGWYKDGSKQDREFLPLTWKANEDMCLNDENPCPLTVKDLYLEVVKRSCRTCHVAVVTNAFNVNDFGSFNSPASRSLINALVCSNNPRRMPNATMTFDLFWLSQHSQNEPHQPDILREFLDKQDNGKTDQSITCPEP